jgi:hypothetical protein
MTHATGAPVVDNLNIETAGKRGPALLQDIWLIEKLAHFDREVIPERRMHAKPHGRLRLTAEDSFLDPVRCPCVVDSFHPIRQLGPVGLTRQLENRAIAEAQSSCAARRYGITLHRRLGVPIRQKRRPKIMVRVLEHVTHRARHGQIRCLQRHANNRCALIMFCNVRGHAAHVLPSAAATLKKAIVKVSLGH